MAAKRKGGGNKHVKIAAAPEPQKQPKYQDPQIEGLPLAWRFSGCDREGPFGWDVQPDAKHREVIDKLHEFEGKNWNELKEGGSHPIPKHQLCKEARERLADTKRDDIDELMSFRLTGDNRVWCVQDGNIMRVLWWDEGHKVYPTPVDKADRRKDRIKRK